MVSLAILMQEPDADDAGSLSEGERLAVELWQVVDRAAGRSQVRRAPVLVEDPTGADIRQVPVEVRAAEQAFEEFQARIEHAPAEDALPMLQEAVRLRSMAEAAVGAAVLHVDQTDAGRDAGFKNPTSVVLATTHSSPAEASRAVGVAQKVHDLPLTHAAWACGDISESHVARLVRAAAGHRREVFLQVEPILVEAAVRLPYKRFCTVIAHFEQLTEPDLDDWDDKERAKRSAELRRCRRERGGGSLEATFTAEGYEAFSRVLREIEDELFEADWAEAEERLGKGNVSIDDLWRTPTQRRADALVELSQRAAAVPPDAKKPRPSVVVHISHEAFEAEIKRRAGAEFAYPANFTAELSDGTPISPGRALALAVEGEVRRLVFDGPDIRTRFGRSKRFADGALREMIMARDRHCQAPGCDVPAWRCDVDHIIDWQHDGETNGDDVELKCPWHNGNKSSYDIFTDPVTGTVAWRRRPPRVA